MTGYVFHGGKFLDPRQEGLIDGIEMLIEGDQVREVSDRPIASASATRIDLDGRTLMPGLIDAHAHVYLVEVDLQRLADVPLTLLALRAAEMMRRCWGAALRPCATSPVAIGASRMRARRG